MKEWPSVRDGGFGPDELHLLDMVFAGAWQHIKGRYHDGDAAAARERLASIVIALGKFKDADAEVLKAAALKAFDQLDSKETAKKVSEVAKAAVGGDIIVLGNVTVPTGAIAMIGLTVATTVGVELARYR